MTALDARRRRLLFRATHRGTTETDRLIGGFVEPRLASFDEATLDALEALMELPDVDLADWLTGRRPIPGDVPGGFGLSALLEEMRAAAVERAVAAREAMR